MWSGVPWTTGMHPWGSTQPKRMKGWKPQDKTKALKNYLCLLHPFFLLFKCIFAPFFLFVLYPYCSRLHPSVHLLYYHYIYCLFSPIFIQTFPYQVCRVPLVSIKVAQMKLILKTKERVQTANTSNNMESSNTKQELKIQYSFNGNQLSFALKSY